MTVALIDGDIVAYRASSAQAKQYDFGDGKTDPSSNPQAAAEAALETISSWQRLAKCRDVLVAFTGLSNFRKLVLPSYKHNRRGKSKPPDYYATVEAVQQRFPSQTIQGLEADDVMGILATTLPKYDGAIVVTLDKDLRTVPGRHFNPTKDKRPVIVTEREADYWWLMQALMGDATDGYTGIPKVGEKRASAILGSPGDVVLNYWPRVVSAFQKAGLTETDAITMARVARILRRCDYDKSTKEIKLWHPLKPESLPLATVCAA